VGLSSVEPILRSKGQRSKSRLHSSSWTAAHIGIGLVYFFLVVGQYSDAMFVAATGKTSCSSQRKISGAFIIPVRFISTALH